VLSSFSLLLEPHIENHTSTGWVNIWITRDLDIKKLKPIVLDINEITISSCDVYKVDRQDVEEKLEYSCEYGRNNDSYVITLQETKYPLTNVSVQLNFVSQLTNTLQGFYRGSFFNENTKTDDWFVSTQFSPIDARRAFPGFDNPGKKATFKISMIRPTDKTTSLSNMPIASTE